MTTKVTIRKDASDWDVDVKEVNGDGTVTTTHRLGDEQEVEIYMHDDLDIQVTEVDKDSPQA